MVNFRQASSVIFRMSRKDYPLFSPMKYTAIVVMKKFFPWLVSQ